MNIFGKCSPIRVDFICTDEVKLDHFLSADEIQLLNKFIENQDNRLIKNKNNIFTDEEIEALQRFDALLDIPLVESTFKPSYKSFKRLLDNKMPIPDWYYKRFNLLYYAAESRHLDALEFLHECDHFDGDPNGESLNIAVENGYLEIVKFLHEHGCKTIYSVLNVAIENNHVEIVEYLLENKFERDEYDVLEAVKRGNLEIVKCLIRHKCPFNDFVVTYAVKYNMIDIAKFLADTRFTLMSFRFEKI